MNSIVHILSKRFVQFKAKLLTLASTDIQLAVEKGEKLDDYTSLRKHQTIEACHAKDDKIDGLIKTIAQQTETITDLVKKNDELIQINTNQTKMINDLQATAGTLVNLNYEQVDKIDELIDLNYNTKYKINDMHKEIKYRDKKIGWVVHEVGKLPMRSIKTKGTNDILVLYTSQMKL